MGEQRCKITILFDLSNRTSFSHFCTLRRTSVHSGFVLVESPACNEHCCLDCRSILYQLIELVAKYSCMYNFRNEKSNVMLQTRCKNKPPYLSKQDGKTK